MIVNQSAMISTPGNGARQKRRAGKPPQPRELLLALQLIVQIDPRGLHDFTGVHAAFFG